MDLNYYLIGVVVVLVLWVISSFNSLISKKNRVVEAFSQIDVQLKRRNSLIPNLLEAVKGYMKHEKSVLTEITKARTSIMSTDNKEKQAQADNVLSGALKTLFAVSENYPKLQASENFKHLQEELSDTETKIAAARQFYNGNVLDFNTSIQTFPGFIFANLFNFSKEGFFQASEDEKKDIKVAF